MLQLTLIINIIISACVLAPKGAYFQKWTSLTPLLKVKWYWNEIYKEIFKLLNKIPKKNYKIIKIEDFSYKDYLMLSKWIGIKPDISEFFLILN